MLKMRGSGQVTAWIIWSLVIQIKDMVCISGVLKVRDSRQSSVGIVEGKSSLHLVWHLLGCGEMLWDFLEGSHESGHQH